MNIVEDIRECVKMAASLGLKCHYVVLTEAMLRDFCKTSGQTYEPDEHGRLHVGHFIFQIREGLSKAFVLPNPQCDVALPGNQSEPAT